MYLRKCVFALALIVGLSIVAGRMVSQAPARSVSTAIWLSGEDPVVVREQHKDWQQKGYPHDDYMNLFDSSAPWSTAASTTTAFKISTQFALRSTDAELHQLIDNLQSRHISLAIEIGLLVGSDRCGKSVEGYGAPAAVETLAKRIQRFGGQLDYAAMDEPVWFGHSQTGAKYCRDSLADLADQIAPKIAILRSYFPNIQVGDIEPISASPHALSVNPHFVADVIAFDDLLQRKTGVKLAFVHADMGWKTPWQPMLKDLAIQVRARGVRFGVICDGDADAGNNRAWVAQAVQRCRSVVADPKTRPDDLIVQSWEPLPTQMLPESAPGSLTHEINAVSKLFH